MKIGLCIRLSVSRLFQVGHVIQNRRSAISVSWHEWIYAKEKKLFSLYFLFSHFGPRDALMVILLLFFFISYAYIYTCKRRNLKETIPSSSVTGSEMGKQNIQAKEVYCRFSRDVTATMLVYITIAKKFLWEFNSIIMQNLGDILPLVCTPTGQSRHVSEQRIRSLFYGVFFVVDVTSASQST